MSVYRRYLLLILSITLTLSFVDRWGMSVALQSIKSDLHLNDAQIGALTGIVFALFYSTFGIPIGRWADRGDRVSVIAICMMLWAVSVVSCGLVSSFFELAVARVATAVGEAGSSPPAYSLISDYFSREERPTAFGLYNLGVPVSMFLGYFFGGWLTQNYGWRVMFEIIGLPGLVVVPVVYLTLREPRRAAVKKLVVDRRRIGAADSGASRICSSDQGKFWSQMKFLWRIDTFRHFLFAMSVTYLFAYGLMTWNPTFFIRSYNLSEEYVGMWLAAAVGGGQLVGSYLGGKLAGRFAPNNERLQIRSVAIAVSIFGIVQAFVYLGRDYHVGFGLISMAMVGGALGNGPVFAAMQTVVPPRMRSVSMSILLFFANLIGMGIGPLAVGVLSDALRQELGAQSLRYALLIMCPGYLCAGWFFLKASGSVSKDIGNQLKSPTAKSTAISTIA